MKAKTYTVEELAEALRGFEPDFLLVGNIPVKEFSSAIESLQTKVDRLDDLLTEIGNKAHDASTGPAVPDTLWEIRAMAYGC